ncbi:MAG: ABC transporter permease [Selenomonadaceae bacterium]|nr:ABC transporter permease [Selenomonadaceae bacterium]
MRILFSIIGILFAWEIFSIAIDLPIVPEPIDVFLTLGKIFADEISIHAIHSIGRILAGLIIAIAIGFPIGVLLGRNSKLDRIFAPTIYLTYPIPKIALLPIAMLLLGIGESSKIFLITLIIVFQILISVRDSTKKIPTEYFEPLISLGADRFEVFRSIIFPAVLPEFLTSIRISLATAISVLFFTETFGTEFGMGFYIFDAWQRIDYLEMYSGIVVLSLIGLAMFVLIDLIEKILVKW